MLKGNLAGFSLGELLQSLAINHHTGTFAITAVDGARMVLYFVYGDIKLFSHGKPTVPRIGELLVHAGHLTSDELESALEKQERTGVMLGKILLQEGHVTKDQVIRALQKKIQEEIYDLFLWTEGEFEFDIDHCPDDLFDSLQKSVGMTINPSAVIMEGLRRLDEWGIINSWIQTDDEIYEPTGREAAESEGFEEAILPLVDGQTPVHEICRSHFGTRFECCKAIFNLLEQETIQPLAVEELAKRGRQALAKKEYTRAVAFLRYATQRCPEEAGLWVDLGNALEKSYQEKEACRAWTQALRLYSDQGDWEASAGVAARLPANAEFELKDLQTLLQTFIELKDIKRGLWAGNLLASKLQDLGETERAADVLDSLIRLDPTDLNLKIQVATLVQKVGDTDRAIAYYDDVAGELEKQKKIKDQIKILRIVADLDPSRAETRQKIAMLVALQERLEKRRKRRLTFAGVGLILLVGGTVVPVIYELKARELYAHAERMEAISMSSKDFTRARESYEELIHTYPLCLEVHDANLALERIANIERGYMREKADEQGRLERKRREVLRAREDGLRSLFEDAKRHETAGELAKAHEILRDAQARLHELKISKDILYPLRITSSPPGAEVSIGEEKIGTAPFVYRYLPDSEIVFHTSRSGCEDMERTVTLVDQHELEFKLERKPSEEYVLASTFRQDLTPVGNLLVFPSRDGHLYAFDPARRALAWSRKVGRFGDRISDLHVRDDRIYLTTVVGEVAAVEAGNGNPLWITPAVRGPALAAPVTSEDGALLAVATLKGDVAILASSSGKGLGRFSTENEIVASPLFAGDLAIAGSTDSHLYGYSVTRHALEFVIELSDEVVVDPIRVNDLVAVATDDGKLHVLDPSKKSVVWSLDLGSRGVHSLIHADGQLLAALATGDVVAVRLDERAASKPWRLGADGEIGGVAYRGDRLYAAHTNGIVSAWDLARQREAWRWQADASIHVPPVVIGEQLWVASASGAVQVLEILD